MNTFVLYFNQCKEDLGPQKKLLMVFHSPHWRTYYIVFSEAEIYRAERILFYPLFNWTLILSCSDMYYFFYKDFIPLFFCFVGRFLTIFSSEFLQPVYSFPLLSEKNNGKRGERVMVDRKSNFWVSSHLTPGHSARVCYSPGTNVNTPIRITLLPRCLSGHWAPDSVHIFCQFEGNLLAFHTYNLLLLLHLKMILTIKLCDMEQIYTQDTQGVHSALVPRQVLRHQVWIAREFLPTL